jgi:hypothetical protein
MTVVGETGDGTSATARCGRTHRRHLTWGSPCDRDAAWYEPTPPRTHRTRGRPRVKGQQRASPQEVGAHTPHRTPLTLA